MILALGLRNIWRQRMRASLALAAIAFGVAGMILSGGFVHDMFAKLADIIIRTETSHLQVAKAGFFGQGSRSPERFVIPDSATAVKAISAFTGVKAVRGRIQFSGLLGNLRTDLAISGEGVEPAGTTGSFGDLTMVEGRALAPRDRYVATIGKGVADALQLKLGSEAVIVVSTGDGAMNTLELEIVGIFQSFSREYDGRAVRIPLATAQELLDTKGANLLVVSIDRTSRTADTAAALRPLLAKQGLEVRAWNELNDFYDKTVELYDRQFGVLRLIIAVMVALSVGNSINMSLFERTGEFGTMRALGNRSQRVAALVMTETALLGIIGAGLGVLLGVAAALVISAFGIPMPPPPNSDLPYVAQIRVVPGVVLGASVFGIIATVLAGILPALRAARMPIAAALRQNA